MVTPELTRTLLALSGEFKRTMTVLIDRKGKIRFVFIGEPCDFPFEKLLGRRRRAKYRLRGLRAVRTNLKGSGLTNSDLTTLANERLDLVASASISQSGSAGRFEYANLIPPDEKESGEVGDFKIFGSRSHRD